MKWHFFLSFVSNRHLRARPKFLLISTTSSSASRASKKEIFILNNQSSVWCYLGMLFSSKSLNNFTEFNIETKERRQNSPQNIPCASTIIKRSTIFSIYLSSKMKSTKMSFFIEPFFSWLMPQFKMVQISFYKSWSLLRTFKLHLEDLLWLGVKTQFLIREVMDTCSDAEENANKDEQKLRLKLFC